MMRNNIDILSSYRFEYVVLDESQNIKNSESLTFRSAIQLQSKHRLALTGTPIENSLKDLWLNFILYNRTYWARKVLSKSSS